MIDTQEEKLNDAPAVSPTPNEANDADETARNTGDGDTVFSPEQRQNIDAAVTLLREEVAELKRALSAVTNAKNDVRTLPDFKTAPSDLYTEEEVRAMSKNEVREHYEKIKQSMKNW